MKKTILFIAMLLAFGLAANAQTASTIFFNSGSGNLPAVGANFNVPINVSGFDATSMPAGITAIIIFFDYDNTILDYTGYTNTIGSLDYSVVVINDTIIRIEVYDWTFGWFNVPDGKLIDLQYDFQAGYSTLEFGDAGSFLSIYSDEVFAQHAIPTLTDGAVEGGYVANTIDGGTWGTATNWDLGVVPNSYHNVGVQPDPAAKGLVTISADAVANNVTIANGGQLTLDAFTLTVGGNFLINSGGSFIQNGTLSVTGTTNAERNIAAWSSNVDGWHLLSSPVASQAISGTFTPTGGGNDYDFYRWDEPSYMWENQKVHLFSPFVVGKGYLVAYEQAGIKTFSGAFNTADVPWNNLTRLNIGDTTGWNLIGNPYPCAIEWGNWSLNNVAANAKVWDEATSAYVDIVPTGIVPAMNGIMVQVTDVAGGSLTIPAADRTHNTTAWYKSEDQRILLIAHDLDHGVLAQQSVVRFNDAATVGYDSEFDSHFLEGYAPVFYSVAEGKYLSTNTLPEWSTELVVPFIFEKNGSSNFMIELAETIEGYDVFLKDIKENITVDLTEMTNYAFTSEEGDDPERFEILFGVVGIQDIDALTAAHVYSFNNKIIITNVTGATNMDILNIQGQTVYNLSFNSTGSEEIAVDLPSGIYMVRLYNSGEIKTSKVFVK